MVYRMVPFAIESDIIFLHFSVHFLQIRYCLPCAMVTFIEGNAVFLADSAQSSSMA